MKSFASLVAVTLASTLAAACSTAEEPAAGAAQSDVVGAADAGSFERSFDLRGASAPLAPSVLESGACYRALAAAPDKYSVRFYSSAGGAGGITSAAAFMPVGGAQPVACLDLHAGGRFHAAFSGVALDAIARYDLGRFQSDYDGPGAHAFAFERGIMIIDLGSPEAEKTASLQKAPNELVPEKAMTIAGSLRSIDLLDVHVDTFYDGVKSMELPMEGAVAATVYGYAWRRAKESGSFSMATDPVGTFTRTGEWFGDGPGMAKTWHFTRGQAQLAVFGQELEGQGWATNERIAVGEPHNGRTNAECKRRWTDEGAVPGFSCTGLADWQCGRSEHAGKQYWTCNGQSAFKCEDGKVIERVCEAGCESRPTGTDDVCRWSCARSEHQGRQIWTCNGDARYRCEDGVAKEQVCAKGCAVHALGTDDECQN